jgi:hypothetical protein
MNLNWRLWLQPAATGLVQSKSNSQGDATATATTLMWGQPQPVVQSFAVGPGPVPVFFPVHRTGPSNTSQDETLRRIKQSPN